jgi:pre-mRNA-processing factor SLU7
MAQVGKVPVSRLIAAGNDDGPVKKNRDDYRKAKELEEARKAGTEAAAVDEDGKDINPHIPQYISDAPWYLDPKGATLTHQRQQEEKIRKFSAITEWYNRGTDSKQPVATKYRKGACENCGAMTHKKKVTLEEQDRFLHLRLQDCLERPRKVGAKFNGAKIGQDEFSQPTLSHDWEMKRDRCFGCF